MSAKVELGTAASFYIKFQTAPQSHITIHRTSVQKT